MTSNQSLLTVLKLASVPLLVLLNGFLSRRSSPSLKSATLNSKRKRPKAIASANIARRSVGSLDASLTEHKRHHTLQPQLGLARWVSRCSPRVCRSSSTPLISMKTK